MKIPRGHLHGRGVWLAHELDPDGRPIFRAVASDGRCLASRSVPPGADADLIRHELERVLDALDPEGVELEVVR